MYLTLLPQNFDNHMIGVGFSFLGKCRSLLMQLDLWVAKTCILHTSLYTLTRTLWCLNLWFQMERDILIPIYLLCTQGNSQPIWVVPTVCECFSIYLYHYIPSIFSSYPPLPAPCYDFIVLNHFCIWYCPLLVISPASPSSLPSTTSLTSSPFWYHLYFYHHLSLPLSSHSLVISLSSLSLSSLFHFFSISYLFSLIKTL